VNDFQRSGFNNHRISNNHFHKTNVYHHDTANNDFHKTNVQNHLHPSNFGLFRDPPRMSKPVLSSTRSHSKYDPSNSPPHNPVAERNKSPPKPLFAEKCPLSDSRLNANTAPYFSPQNRNTNTHVQVEPVQVVEAITDEFISYVNVKISGITTKVLFDSGCSKSLISIDLVRRIHAKLQPLVSRVDPCLTLYYITL